MRSYHTPKRRSTGKIGISMLSNKITNRMIIYLLLFGIITHFCQGIERKEPDGEQLELGGDRKDPDHSRVKRGKQRYMPIDEMQGFVWKEIQIIEELRKKCVTGTFFSLVTKDCKSCDKYCQNGTDMKSCGKECIEYYDKLQIQQLSQELSEIKTKQPDLTLVWIAISVIGVSVIGLIIAVIFLIIKCVTKAGLERKLHGYDSNDVSPIGSTNAITTPERDNRRDDGAQEVLIHAVEEPPAMQSS